MTEYYKKVHCVQFLLSEKQKEDVLKGQKVTFESEPVRHGANGRFHVLIRIGERLTPLQEGQWLVRNPEIEIYHDSDFQQKFVKHHPGVSKPNNQENE